MLDITGATPTLVNWETDRYRAACAQGYETYMHDVDFAPDGSYFAVAGSGGTQLRDAKTGEKIGPLLSHGGPRGAAWWTSHVQQVGFQILEQGTRPMTFYLLARRL